MGHLRDCSHLGCIVCSQGVLVVLVDRCGTSNSIACSTIDAAEPNGDEDGNGLPGFRRNAWILRGIASLNKKAVRGGSGTQ